LTEEDQSSGTESQDDASEIPDWLQDLRDSLPEDVEAEIDGTGREDEKPDWLAELRSSAGEAEPETTPTVPEAEVPGTAPGAEEMPEWLARLRPATEEVEAETTPPPPEPGAEEMEPEAADEEMPEWLARLRTSAEEGETEAETAPPPPELAAEEAEPEATDEELPEWIAGHRPAAEEAEAEIISPPPETVTEGDELPDWLAELQATAAEAESTPPDSELEGEELPDWLAEPEPLAEDAEPVPTDLEVEEAEIPDWLAALKPAAPEKEPEAEALDLEAGEKEAPPAMEAESASFAPEAEEAELPGWLAEFQPEGEVAEPEPFLPELAAESAAEPPVLDIEAGEAPDGLSELQPSEGEEEPTTEAPETEGLEMAAAAAAAATAAVVPDLLGATDEETAEEAPPPVEERPVEGEDEIAKAETAPEPPAPEIVEGEVPDWLAAIEIEVEEEAAPSGEEMLVELEGPDWPPSPMPGWAEEDALAPAEIPAWLLALKPTELREEGEDEDLTDAFEEPGDTTGLLAGLKGTLPVEMLIAQPRAATEIAAPDALDIDSPQARMFAEVVGQPPTAEPKELVPEPTRALAQVPRLIIYLVLIVAVAIPILLGKPLLPHTVEPTLAEEDLYATIEALANNAPVLLAFDYDPSTSGEMEVVAQSLVGQLMDRGARVVIMSLLPAGPATAQSLVDKLAAERTDYADSYGQRYANLGYLPGQAAAVRLVGVSLETAFPHDYFGTPLSDLPVMQGLSNGQDFDLVLELAAAQDSLRWWVEQAGTPYEIPLGAGVSASVAPLARPYYETEPKQLVGMVAGVQGTAGYEALRSGQAGLPDALAARLDSLLAGYAILLLVLLVGNVVYLTQRGAGREH
jgi:hypothetical protein